MKNLFYTACLLFVCQSSFAQNGVYMFTETWCKNTSTSTMLYDSIYVTNPMGSTVGYSIPFFTEIGSGHNSQFNSILNGITSQGYKIISTDWPDGFVESVVGISRSWKTIFLAQPWTLTSRELDSANSTQLDITKIYPNPTAGITTVECAFIEGNTPLELIIYNISGFIIHRQEIKNNKSGLIEFDLSGLPNGEYFITLINNKVYCSPQKIIVKK